MASGDATYLPIKNTAYRAYFPILDADGDPVETASGLDSEVSIDGATMADCTNEATYIASSAGSYYLDLTASEMDSSCSLAEIKVSTPGKTTVLTMYPVEEGDYGTAMQTKVASALTNIAALENVSTADIVTHTTSALVTIDVAQASSVAAIVDYAQASALTTVDGRVTDVAQASAIAALNNITANAVTLDIDSTSTQLATIISDYAQASAITALNDITSTAIMDVMDMSSTQLAAILADIAAIDAVTATAVMDIMDASSTQLAAIIADTADMQPSYAQASALATVDGKVTDVAQASAVAAIDAVTATAVTDIMDANSTQLAAILADTEDIQPSYAQASAIAALHNISAAGVTNHIDANSTQLATIISDYAQASALTTVDGKVTDVAQASALTTVDGKVTDVAQTSAIAALNDIAAGDVTDDIDSSSTQLATIISDYAQASALLTAAAVKTQVASALSSDTYAELGAGTATTTASISTKLSYLHQVLINKNTSTSVLASIYAADGSTTVMTSTVSSDGTTYTKGRFS